MTVRPSSRRIDKFKAKYDPERIKQAIESQRDGIIEQQAAKQQELVDVEIATKMILDDSNIPTIFYPAYLNFAREIWKIRNRFAGETVKTEADIILYKWTMRQLKEDVLKRIRNQVFTLEAPKKK